VLPSSRAQGQGDTRDLEHRSLVKEGLQQRGEEDQSARMTNQLCFSTL
jgi:hypothetical protein